MGLLEHIALILLIVAALVAWIKHKVEDYIYEKDVRKFHKKLKKTYKGDRL